MAQTLVGLGTSLILSIMLVFLLMVALYNSSMIGMPSDSALVSFVPASSPATT
jgi:hypothetical protein